MPTVGEEILQKYYKLQQTCKAKVGQFPLPEVGDVDAEEIVMIVLNFFRGKSDYLPTLQSYCQLKGLDQALLDTVYPEIHEFLTWILELLSRTHI